MNRHFIVRSSNAQTCRRTIIVSLVTRLLGDIFVVYFVLVCFIAPLLIGYWQDRKTAIDVLVQLLMENEKCKKEAKKMASDYKDLIDNFVQTHK